MSALYTKLIKLTTLFEEENLVLSMTLNKFKAERQVVNHLWNVSKYFNKLETQIQKAENDKKKSKQSK